MKKDRKNEKSVEKTTPKPISGKSTEALTKRHLKDKNDKITDDDIRNIQIDTSVDRDEVIPLNKKRAHDADKDNPKSTPWDIISE
jgi:hypothetical protein